MEEVGITFDEWLAELQRIGVASEEIAAMRKSIASAQRVPLEFLDQVYDSLEMHLELALAGHLFSGSDLTRSIVRWGGDEESSFSVLLYRAAESAEQHKLDSTPLHLLLTNGPVTVQMLQGAQAVVGRLRTLLGQQDRVEAGQQRFPPPIPAEVPLGERARLVLTVLREGKAFDSDHRMRTADIACKAAGAMTDPNPYKEVIAELKRLRYVDTKEGRGGGCWLTVAGQQRVEKL